MQLKTLNALKTIGLRSAEGLDTRSKTLSFDFEAPCQLNNNRLAIYQRFKMGAYSTARSGTIRYLKSIGRYTNIGPNVVIGEGEHPTNWLSINTFQYTNDPWDFWPDIAKRKEGDFIKRTKDNQDGRLTHCIIGNDVWIGANVLIRRGVKVGDGAIIAGNAFVGKDVPPYAIVGGTPAKTIRFRFDQNIIDELLDLKWWQYDAKDLNGVPFNDVRAAIDEIKRRAENGLIEPRPEEYRTVSINSKGWLTPS